MCVFVCACGCVCVCVCACVRLLNQRLVDAAINFTSVYKELPFFVCVLWGMFVGKAGTLSLDLRRNQHKHFIDFRMISNGC